MQKKSHPCESPDGNWSWAHSPEAAEEGQEQEGAAVGSFPRLRCHRGPRGAGCRWELPVPWKHEDEARPELLTGTCAASKTRVEFIKLRRRSLDTEILKTLQTLAHQSSCFAPDSVNSKGS